MANDKDPYPAWAADLGVRRYSRTPCLCSLLGRRCCQVSWGVSGYGTGPNKLCQRLCVGLGGWDHARLWGVDARPVLVVSEPYGSRGRAAELAAALARRPEPGTVAVILGDTRGPHSLWAPGGTTPILAVNLTHPKGAGLTARLLEADPAAELVEVR